MDEVAISAEVPAADGLCLHGRVYESERAERLTALLLPGIGVPQRALRHLGAFLARQGVRALSIDYRGMGESPSGSSSASLSIWAQRDAVAALEYAEQRWGEPVVLFGHSFGGQVLGLADAFSRLRACVLLASQFGQPAHWDGIGRIKIAAYWHVILPLATRLFQTVPGWTGAGEALPRGVAREWALWGRSPEWYLSHVLEARTRLGTFDRPILAYAASDDPIAPPRAVSALLSRFSAAPLRRRDVSPHELGVRSIGHFGLLRPLAEPLWHDMLAFVRQHGGAVPRVGAVMDERPESLIQPLRTR